MLDFVSNIDAFRLWLVDGGSIVNEPVSEWEILRYSHPQDGLCSAYRRKNNCVTLPPVVQEHYSKFIRNEIPGRIDRPAPKAKRTLRELLLDRDGDTCFFCGDFLEGDASLEHLLPISKGGTNDPSNLCLAHESCNMAAGNLSIVEKIAYRESLRAARDILPPWESNKVGEREACIPQYKTEGGA